MAKIRPAFMRPIEHTPDDGGFDFSIGSNEYLLTGGTYANVISLARAVMAATAEITDMRMSPDADGYIQFYGTPSVTVNFVNQSLRSALGFATDFAFSGTGWSTANNVSPYVWIPEHPYADQSGFIDAPSFIGEMSSNGAIAGLSNGDVCKRRTMRFTMELTEHLGIEQATTAAQASGCLDNFVKGALESAPSLPTNASPKGFWFYEDINAMIADCTPAGSEWATAGGTEFGQGDTYVFCNFDPRTAISDWRSESGFPIGRIRYHVTLMFQTSICPVFIT